MKDHCLCKITIFCFVFCIDFLTHMKNVRILMISFRRIIVYNYVAVVFVCVFVVVVVLLVLHLNVSFLSMIALLVCSIFNSL